MDEGILQCEECKEAKVALLLEKGVEGIRNRDGGGG